MRNFITIVEEANKYPTKIETGELVDLVKEIHHSSHDFEEGNLYDRIWQFYSYDLKMLPVSSLQAEEWDRDDDVVDEYTSRLTAGEIPPPILYDPVNDSIIDGTHRLAAAIAAGQSTIAAYVGDENTYEELTESVLTERATYMEVPRGFDASDTHQIPVYKNPSSATLLGLLNRSSYGNMRGLIEGDDVFWWDSNDALHAGVKLALGLHDDGDEDGADRLILAKEAGAPFLSIAPEHKDHPRLLRLLPQVVTE